MDAKNLLPLVSSNNRGTTIIGTASRLEMDAENQLRYGSLRKRDSGPGMNSGTGHRNKYSAMPSAPPASYHARLYGRQDQNSPSDNDIDGDLSSNDDDESEIGRMKELGENRRNDSLRYQRVLRLYGGAGSGLSEKDRLTSNISSSTSRMEESSMPDEPPLYHEIDNGDSGGGDGGGIISSNKGMTTSSAIYGQRLHSDATLKASGKGGNIFQSMASQNTTTGPLVPLPNHVHPSQLLEPSDAPPMLRASGLNSSSYPSHHRNHHPQSSASSAFAAFAASRFSFSWSKNCSHDRQPCIWRIAIVFLIFLALILLFMVFRQASVDSSSFNPEDGKPCIVVEESSDADKSLLDPQQSETSFDPDSDGQSKHHISKAKQSSKSSSSLPSLSDHINGGHRESSQFSRKSFSNLCPTVNLPHDSSLFPEVKFRLASASITASLLPHRSWTTQMSLNDANFIRFIFQSLPVWSRLALLARRNEPPTLTRYDLLEVISPHESRSPSSLNPSSPISSALHASPSERDAESSSKHELSVELLDYFEAGTWYLVIINDGDQNIPLNLNLSKAMDIPTSCPSNCNGHGKCQQGKCICFPGFIGHDCADSVCPVLCSGHGRYLQGRCQCEIGWKGSECNIRSSDCEVSNCNEHGRCVAGQCVCLPGFKGDNCEFADCLDPDCADHGACIDGQCWCKTGWKGENCSQIDRRLSKYFPHCSGRGVYDLDSEKCSCFAGWLGEDCSMAKCDLDCGQHGVCEAGKCVCDAGWEGNRCERLSCDPRCLEHGQCSNGTCVCVEGWMGKHCTFNGCPSSCSNHGVCAKDLDMDRSVVYKCTCKPGWTGRDCSYSMETQCSNDVDDDRDGLTDCADSECCSTEECRDSLMCLRSPDPLDILLKKSPPSVTASFYQKMKFLIEEGSVQSYAHRDDYSESRVSVIRGQVITPDGNGVTGIRISVATDPQFGFTLTRPDGWFDILVNGGNMVTLQFQRNPFHPIKRTIMVPWNEIMVIQDPIVMSAAIDSLTSGHPHHHSVMNMGISNEQFSPVNMTSHCWDHDYSLMKPNLFQTLRPDAEGGCTEESAVIAESQVLLETLSIPGSSLKLVHQSSSAPGYLSAINLQLTSSSIPPSLRIVHLRIILEGNLFTKVFDAEPDIKYTFVWNKRNVYRQKVYGLTNARVYVGYQYDGCSQKIWSTLTTQIRGFDMEISELASWNLNIHHRYNFHEGILQKGDGSSIFFKQQSRVVNALIGNGEPRSPTCKARECDGLARSNKLLSPITLTNGPDGSVYVGDANLVRRIKPDGYVYTIFKLSEKASNGGRGIHHQQGHHHQSSSSTSSSPTYNYHIHFGSYDGHLYIADPERHQILRIHTVDRIDDPESNYDAFVGSGARCLPRDRTNCGDGGSALEASLVFPKGMAFGLDGSLYFADGSAIRMVNWKGIIQTVLGDNHHSSHHHRSGKKQWKPIPCDGSLPADQVKLRWPTEVAIHPIDGSLHFLDDQMVFRLTLDKRVMIIVGRPSYCPEDSVRYGYHHQSKNEAESESDESSGHSSHHTRSSRKASRHHPHGPGNMDAILAFAFSSNGDLFVASVGRDGANSINLVTSDGHNVHYMGITSQSKFLAGKMLVIDQNSFCEIESCRDMAAHNCTCALPSTTGPSSLTIKHDSKIQLARETPLISPTSITVTSDGVLHVADEGTFRIISAVPYIPGPDESLLFTIASPETSELYMFNKYGQHIATRNALTGQTLHSFLYDVNTSFGKLSAVTDASGSKVSFLRDSVSALYSIETANVQKCRVAVNSHGLLENFTDPDNLLTRFTYDSSTGLIISRTDSAGFSYHYQYSPSGRLVGIVKPSGVRTSISFDFDKFGSSLRTQQHHIGYDAQKVLRNVVVQVNKDSASVLYDGDVFKVNLHEDKSIDILTAWREGVLWQSSVHKVLLQTVPIQAGMFPVLSHQINFLLSGSLYASSLSPFSTSSSGHSKTATNFASISWDYDIKYAGRKGGPENSSLPKMTASSSVSGQAIAAVERILYINNTRFLSVEYDRNANREILYNNSRRPFLVVQYDNSSRPIQWLPTETRLPLNVIYDRFGRLAGWQQGTAVSETFFYDRSGLLAEIRYPDSTSIKYSYDESGGRSKPSKITLRSGKQYKYLYDERSGLRKVITPRRSEHRIALVISMGFYKLVYTPAGNTRNSNYVLYLDEDRKPLLEVFPDNQARVVYIYNERSKLSQIVYGGGKIEKHYGKPSSNERPRRQRNNTTIISDHLLHSESWKEGLNEVTMQYQHHNSLIVKISLRIVSTFSHLSNFEFTYDYDEFGRKRSIAAKIISSSASPSISLPVVEYTYNPKTGKLENFGHFQVHDHYDYQHHQNESLITDGVATFSKIFDSATHQMRQMSLSIKDKEVYRMDLMYNANGAIVTTKTFMRHLGASKIRLANYTYDSDEQLIEVAGRDQWKFSYDDNGNLASIQYQNRKVDISYDMADRVTRYGDMAYVANARGIFIRRGEERLYYNTYGLLMRNVKPGKHDVRYLYDSRGRLVARKDHAGNHTQYFYGDIERPHLVTHMFNNADRTITSLVYDDSGLPIMVQVNHQTFYVACDQVGTPLLVYDHRGDVIKEINRGPTGHILYDSNTAFYLPIGFHGGILDPKTEIVHFGGSNIYDPTIGQWLVPNWAQVLSNIEEPAFLSLYRFSKNDPINYFPGETRSSKLDLNRWIQHQGIDLTGFDIGGGKLVTRGEPKQDVTRARVPSNTWGYHHYSNYDALYYVPNLISSSLSVPQLPLLSAFWCSLQKNTQNFAVSSFIKKSVVKSEELLDSTKPSKLSTENQPFGYGITLSVVNSVANVFSSPDADKVRRDVFTKVFNKSLVLDLNLIVKSLDVFYFVKPELWKVSEDHLQLQRLGNLINVTIHEIKDDPSDGSNSKANHKGYHQVDIRIHTKGAILNIRYGTSLERERNRVLRLAKKYAITERWAREVHLARNNHHQFLSEDSSAGSSAIERPWNENEKEILLNTGLIPGYRAEYYHSVEKYPQLADDPSNIIFIKS